MPHCDNYRCRFKAECETRSRFTGEDVGGPPECAPCREEMKSLHSLCMMPPAAPKTTALLIRLFRGEMVKAPRGFDGAFTFARAIVEGCSKGFYSIAYRKKPSGFGFYELYKV